MMPSRFSARIAFVAFTLFLGAFAGAFVWLVFFAMNHGIALIWETVPHALGIADSPLYPLYPLAVCIAGGVAIGLCERRFGPYPQSLQTVMSTVKKTGRYEYRDLGKMTLSALLPLMFGGSIGPEAGLTGIIAGLCTWAGDRMRHVGGEFKEAARIGLAAVLSAIFSAPLFGLMAPFSSDDTNKGEASTLVVPKATKLALYLCAIAGALGAMFLLGDLFGRNGGLPRFLDIAVGQRELVLLVPLALVGGCLGWLFHACEFGTKALANKIGAHPIAKAVLAGVTLALCGLVLPYTMFAGEEQAGQLADSWTQMGVLALFATALVKVLVTPLCINFGWRGGHFFPVIFAGVALGYGCALVCGANAVFCLCACTAGLLGAVTRQPVMAVLLLCLCFPLRGVAVMLVAAALGSVIPLPRAWQHSDRVQCEP